MMESLSKIQSCSLSPLKLILYESNLISMTFQISEFFNSLADSDFILIYSCTTRRKPASFQRDYQKESLTQHITISQHTLVDFGNARSPLKKYSCENVETREKMIFSPSVISFRDIHIIVEELHHMPATINAQKFSPQNYRFSHRREFSHSPREKNERENFP